MSRLQRTSNPSQDDRAFSHLQNFRGNANYDGHFLTPCPWEAGREVQLLQKKNHQELGSTKDSSPSCLKGKGGLRSVKLSESCQAAQVGPTSS